MLTKIAIENFKSIGKRIELELKPLTILVGPNASGKSNILEALSLLVQSIGWREGYDVLGQNYIPLVRYSRPEDIAYKGDLRKPISIEVHVKVKEDEEQELLKLAELINFKDLGISIDNKITSVGYRCSFEMINNSMWGHQEIFCNEKKVIGARYEKVSDSTFSPVFSYPPSLKTLTPSGNCNTILDRNVFRVSSSLPQHVSEILLEKVKPLSAFAMRIVDIIVSRLRPEPYKTKVYFLSSQRTKIKPEVVTSEYPKWVGNQGEYLLPVLAQISMPRNEKKRKKIEKWALEFGIRNPWAGWSGPGKASGEYIDSELNVPLNLALASYGSSQILTIITQLFWAEEGDIILIEEPEISIHPKGQAKLPELFAEAIEEGKQIIITTHSGYFPLALPRALKKGLKVEDIAVYEVNKNSEGTYVERRKINEKGYIEEWIKSFYEIEEELVKEWARLISTSSPEK